MPFPGVSVTDGENLVVKPIEDELSDLSGLLASLGSQLLPEQDWIHQVNLDWEQENVNAYAVEWLFYSAQSR